MIPKIIHYCWFGGNPLPASAIKCIESWKKYLPDYEIKEWNESNYDVNAISYIKDAYADKKYAFVSDYARFDILYKYGGVYFDTDVEAVAQMNDILAKGSFMAWETPSGNGDYKIAPGLGLATEPQTELYKEILQGFQKLNYYSPDGERNNYTMIPMVTDILSAHGMKQDGTLQEIQGVTLYPDDYFCPMNALTGVITKTPNTRSIHHYTMSWLSEKQQKKLAVTRVIRRYLGTEILQKIKKIFG